MKSLCQASSNRIYHKDGFTLIEVMVALVLLMVAMLAVGTMQITAIRGNAYSKEMQMATLAGREVVERVMATPYNSVAVGNIPGLLQEETVTSKDPTNPGLPYKRTWSVTQNSPFANAITVTATVTWEDSSGKHTIDFITIKTQ
ncbi:MAG TPA: prepilin-type N-terminal cleavage/methylation domain-containing protein [Thermodesulfovibrionia bacterium]|nr:prepilin-type N-terminal cleavage/methylation domain-containing protein [Thermodesulfovibrionia bacterium]